MTTDVNDAAEATQRCAQHPDVETDLACGKCGTLICPRCLVQTPVGARCRPCAQLRRLPMYTLSPASLVRVGGVAVALGIAVGLAWGLLLPFGFGFFALFLGLFAGYGMAAVLDRAGGRKRGPTVQGAAVAGIIVAYLVRNLVLTGAPIVPNDLWGLLFVAAAAVVAWNQLR